MKHDLIWWIAHFFGLGTSNNSFYDAWSGVASDVTELVIVGGIVAAIHHVNCHVKGCWRLGRHPVEGTPYKTCRKHHPKVPDEGVTAEHIAEVYHRVNEPQSTGTSVPRRLPNGRFAPKQRDT